LGELSIKQIGQKMKGEIILKQAFCQEQVSYFTVSTLPMYSGTPKCRLVSQSYRLAWAAAIHPERHTDNVPLAGIFAPCQCCFTGRHTLRAEAYGRTAYGCLV